MSTNKRVGLALGIGLVVGALLLISVRFVTFTDDRIHEHANFALYINGVRDEFKSTTFYEETQACSSDNIGPKSRVHLHDQKPQVLHIHDGGATWGHLFANLGYGLNNKSVQTDEGVFVDGEEGNKLTFVLNGKTVDGVANEAIKSEDVLLINYGNDSQATLDERFAQIERDAAEYNETTDPSTCSGSAPITFWDRLQYAIGIGI